MKYLINGSPALIDGPGITFDLEQLARFSPADTPMTYLQARRSPTMLGLFRRLSHHIGGPIRDYILPDQIYVDLHWHWEGQLRNATPVSTFRGKLYHPALSLWSLWQCQPMVIGPASGQYAKRSCPQSGCVNPHHYRFPFPEQPAPTSPVSAHEDIGSVALARIAARVTEIEKAGAEFDKGKLSK